MDETELKIGDAVRHKTGGPKMVFVGTSQTGQAICEWFDRGPQQDTFSFAALEKYEPPKASFSLSRA
ncbi:DUF2158 domain-containing protein [Mesorhizobium sp. M1E.F.Ca.ET.063.01.1.1]|uniref:YodC family protein n=1 Tax=Mesorhizobium sp. M1E.F.Ca.ET.063.01.1.1 TaxID=2496750 RepID=UPI000FC9F21F|nr:DUF2158 domain-containing protein [Mesorhizobium sp. M1E.F.Ca.ET.063.01.1.1]RUW85193.1 DUF2158 domain-containing protein [Mesorhizobium sp. M1E.F.Ca.ET.063.01.1.1]